jgi:hypothetical protein
METPCLDDKGGGKGAGPGKAVSDGRDWEKMLKIAVTDWTFAGAVPECPRRGPAGDELSMTPRPVCKRKDISSDSMGKSSTWGSRI